jgi:photosystem II stability/assembly factor-like uncharacterized protein
LNKIFYVSFICLIGFILLIGCDRSGSNTTSSFPNTDETQISQVASETSSPTLITESTLTPEILDPTDSPASIHEIQPKDIVSLAMVSSKEGWVGGMGFLNYTRDGWKTWDRQYEGRDTVTDLFFINQNVGWMKQQIDGEIKFAIYHTIDRGSHWEHLSDLINDDPIHFISTEVGFIGNQLSEDGGKTWRSLSLPKYSVGHAYFQNEKNGWVLTFHDDKFFVNKTKDGGTTWKSVYQRKIESEPMDAIIRSSGPLDAWVIVIGGVGMSQQSYSLFQTADGGNHFTPVLAHSSAGAGIAPGFDSIENSIPSGPGSYSGNLILINSTNAFLSGSCSPCGDEGMASIEWTADGGKTWTDSKQNIPGQNSIISFINNKEGCFQQPKQSTVLQIVEKGGRSYITYIKFKPSNPLYYLLMGCVGLVFHVPAGPHLMLLSSLDNQ